MLDRQPLEGVGVVAGPDPLGARQDAEVGPAAAEYVAQYKRIRATVQLGTLRRLSGAAPDDVTAVSYLAADGGQVAVFAFAPSVRRLRRTVQLRLRGLDPAATYADAATGTRYSGALLLHHGLRVPLVGDHASELVVLDRI